MLLLALTMETKDENICLRWQRRRLEMISVIESEFTQKIYQILSCLKYFRYIFQT